jgi:hypothetical protein
VQNLQSLDSPVRIRSVVTNSGTTGFGGSIMNISYKIPGTHILALSSTDTSIASNQKIAIYDMETAGAGHTYYNLNKFVNDISGDAAGLIIVL